MDQAHHFEKDTTDVTAAVLVVGGGIGGVQAALDLAASGFYVYLVEQSPAIGGVMAMLDKTFPTNDCSMCILSPKLVECGRHPNIELITNADVLDVTGEPGSFTATLRKRPRFIDTEKCTGCGICQEKCPKKITQGGFDAGLGMRKAVYIPFPQAVPKFPVIDRENCTFFQKGACKACQKFCPSGAIDFGQQEETLQLEVGAVILAPGYETFDPRTLAHYRYGQYANVVTSLQFERILSPSGPYQGEVLRPSDRQPAHKIAWIQCVGSRGSPPENEHCSSVCCTYAIKEAVVAREHDPSIAATIFYIDIRTFGKGFEAYYNRARGEHGVRFVRCRPSVISQNPANGNLALRYENEEGKVEKEEFDLVVLSVGLQISQQVKELASRLGLALAPSGFCQTGTFEPVDAARPGVFVCGAFQSPQDIPETVMQASAAAASASALLSSGRGSRIKTKEYPPERDIRGEPPRTGVFVCNCGVNIAGVVDVASVKAYAAALPGVVYAEEDLYTCSQDSQERLKRVILDHGLNRVVVASCSPRTHEPLFRQTLREAGLNQFLFEMANIRDQCSWVHKAAPREASQKAKDLVRMAVAKASLLQPLQIGQLPVSQAALVVGGGIAGMEAALNIAAQGFPAVLVERDAQLGGIARRLHATAEGGDVQAYLADLICRVSRDPRITVYTQSEILSVAGFVGNYNTRLSTGREKREITLNHGVVVLATGAQEYHPQEYRYGEDGRILTLLELEERTAAADPLVTGSRSVVFIQCVGSRSEARPYCSRVCCIDTVKNALALKVANPERDVYILYRDMRTYGLKEEYYRQAREQGIVFIRYDEKDPPDVQLVRRDSESVLEVTVLDAVLGERLLIDADLLALAVATLPGSGNQRLSQLFKVPLNEDGFFLEAHMKLRPVEFATDGVFLCGLAHGPKLIENSIAQAKAAVSRACVTLSKGQVEAGGLVSSVNTAICSGCGACVQVCAYQAVELDIEKDVAAINPALCKGCGACVSSCICGAITIKGSSDEQILAMIEAL